MSQPFQELEVKYYLANPTALEQRLKNTGAELIQPRVLETNLRFDTPARDLARAYKVLRLRQDTQVRLTYKGPGELQGGVRARREIEFIASDYDAARAFIEALGYQVSLLYEKYRTIYALPGVHITLDQMPYGHFAEIEGENPAVIQQTNTLLGLDWEARILDSYTTLFQRLRQTRQLTFRDLSFANFAGLEISAADLGVRTADPHTT